MGNEHQKRSRQQEDRAARVYGGSRNPGSGNGATKNDVRTDSGGPGGSGHSIEFKTTTRKSYGLTLDELLLAERNALLDGRDVLFGIDYRDLKGKTHRYVVETEADFLAKEELLRQYDEVFSHMPVDLADMIEPQE